MPFSDLSSIMPSWSSTKSTQNLHKEYFSIQTQRKSIQSLLINHLIRVFTSFNEKAIHVWHPETGEQLFNVNFDLNSATQALTAAPDESAEIITDKKKKPKKKEMSEKDFVNRQISCICYSKKYYLYFAFTRNFKLIIFNEYLNQVGTDIPLNIRLVQSCMFLDETMELIVAGVLGCFIIKLNIKYTYPPR